MIAARNSVTAQCIHEWTGDSVSWLISSREAFFSEFRRFCVRPREFWEELIMPGRRNAALCPSALLHRRMLPGDVRRAGPGEPAAVALAACCRRDGGHGYRGVTLVVRRVRS